MKMRDKYPRLFTMMSVGLLLMVIGLFFMLMSCVGSFNEMEWAKTNTPLFISVVLFLLGAMLFFTARQMFKTRKAKNEQVELSHVQELIDRACQIPEHRGQVCNAFQHIWGYFKKKATDAERKDYMLLLDRYRFGQASKEDLIAKTRDLLDRYPNTYLQHSTLLKGDSHETLA